MTPKEKAIDLTADFYDIKSNEPYYGIEWEMAKRCSLIAVNEMLKEINDYFLQQYDAVDRYYYWKKVKEEINKL